MLEAAAGPPPVFGRDYSSFSSHAMPLQLRRGGASTVGKVLGTRSEFRAEFRAVNPTVSFNVSVALHLLYLCLVRIS
ncbi:hypothetical protein NDU88_009543 [Pleurodeles waltl]|uniref:Uncharacterized protein n=1 Tax=Pleurodeles waltl TaxID=8319 RepID=A0AAV7RWE9_PLEWA|nr:hypothetical protein NDU88_009543 [Pleurodeles waltl]